MSSAGIFRGVSIVVPVYRNSDSIRALAERTDAVMSTWSEGYELILVDDGSPDDSWEIISSLAQQNSRIVGVRLSRNFGQHPAIAAGFERARGQIIVLMDADLEDRPENIPQLISEINDKIDVVYTIKQGERTQLLSRLSSRVFHAVFSRITNKQVPTDIGTFRAFKRKVLMAMLAYREYDVLFGPLMFYVGFSSTFVETIRDLRPSRTSSYTFLKRLSLAVRSLASYSDFPNKVFFSFGALVFILVVTYAIVVLARYILLGSHAAPSGLTLIVLILMFYISVTLIGFGVIGSYVFRVYQEVLRRPRYLVTEELNVEAPDGRAIWLNRD
jgi:dolichol-phosphate mannosyltransferase